MRLLRHEDAVLHVGLLLGQLRVLHRPGRLLPRLQPERVLRQLRHEEAVLHVKLLLGQLRVLHGPGRLHPRRYDPERLRSLRAEDLQQLLLMGGLPAPAREDLSMGERHELGVLRLAQVALLPAAQLRGRRMQVELILRLGEQRLLLTGAWTSGFLAVDGAWRHPSAHAMNLPKN